MTTLLTVIWEGSDGSGKTTLMHAVAQILRDQGFRLGFYKTPSDTPTGSFAKSYGNSEEVDGLTRMLLFLSNTISDSKLMLKEIRKGIYDFYFIDRYYLCSLVYGLAILRLSYGKLVNHSDLASWIQLIQRSGSNIILKPDFYVIADVDEATRRERIERKSKRAPAVDAAYETNMSLQQEVREFYLAFKELSPSSVIWAENSEGSLREVASRVAGRLLEAWKERSTA